MALVMFIVVLLNWLAVWRMARKYKLDETAQNNLMSYFMGHSGASKLCKSHPEMMQKEFPDTFLYISNWEAQNAHRYHA